MKRSPLKRLGKRGKEKQKRMDAITPELIKRSGGVCEVCGKPPDWRGFQRAHIERHGGETLENIRLTCFPCHYGENMGHSHNEVESNPMWSKEE